MAKIRVLHPITSHFAGPSPRKVREEMARSKIAQANNWLTGLGIDPVRIPAGERALKVAELRAKLFAEGKISEHVGIHARVATRQALAERTRGTRKSLMNLRNKKGIGYDKTAVKRVLNRGIN